MHLANLAMMGDLSTSAFTYLVARSNCQRTNIHDIFALNLVGIIKFVGANLGTHRSHYRFALITENEGRVELLVDTRLCDVDIECQSRNLFSTMKGNLFVVRTSIFTGVYHVSRLALEGDARTACLDIICSIDDLDYCRLIFLLCLAEISLIISVQSMKKTLDSSLTRFPYPRTLRQPCANYLSRSISVIFS